MSIGDPPWPYGWPQYLPPAPTVYWPAPPRCLMVNVPLPQFGQVTVVVVDGDGNVTIKVDQPRPP